MKLKAIHIDNSTLQSYKDCPRLFGIKALPGLDSRFPAPALELGREVHAELESHYRDANYRSHHPIIAQYQTHYQGNDYKRPAEAAELHLESTIGVIDGVTINYGGTIDLIDDNRIIDHKTGSNIYFHRDGFELESQFSGYRLLYYLAHGKIIQEYEINSISTRPDKSGRYAFMRQQFAYRQTVEQTQAEILAWIKKLLFDLNNNNFYDLPNYGHCTKYNGCVLRNHCMALTPADRNATLELDFILNPWKGFKMVYE